MLLVFPYSKKTPLVQLMNMLLHPGWFTFSNSNVKQWKRRARLVADGTGLENRKGFTLLVGSNPTPSAEHGIC
jgi:hypothetical protein